MSHIDPPVLCGDEDGRPVCGRPDDDEYQSSPQSAVMLCYIIVKPLTPHDYGVQITFTSYQIKNFMLGEVYVLL